MILYAPLHGVSKIIWGGSFLLISVVLLKAGFVVLIGKLLSSTKVVSCSNLLRRLETCAEKMRCRLTLDNVDSEDEMCIPKPCAKVRGLIVKYHMPKHNENTSISSIYPFLIRSRVGDDIHCGDAVQA